MSASSVMASGDIDNSNQIDTSLKQQLITASAEASDHKGSGIGGDGAIIQLSLAEQHLLPYVQRASSQELTLSLLEIGSDEWRHSINSAVACGELTLPLYITAFTTALTTDDWLMISRLNCAHANEQKEETLTPNPHADVYYFTNIIGLTLCAKHNTPKSAQAICNHLNSFYKERKVDVGETHFLRSFFTGANHPLYVAQTYNNTSIIKIMVKTLTTKEGVDRSGLIFPRFYEEVFWHAMISKNVDFVKYLKCAPFCCHQKCDAEMRGNIEIFLKEYDI